MYGLNDTGYGETWDDVEREERADEQYEYAGADEADAALCPSRQEQPVPAGETIRALCRESEQRAEVESGDLIEQLAESLRRARPRAVTAARAGGARG